MDVALIITGVLCVAAVIAFVIYLVFLAIYRTPDGYHHDVGGAIEEPVALTDLQRAEFAMLRQAFNENRITAKARVNDEERFRNLEAALDQMLDALSAPHSKTGDAR